MLGVSFLSAVLLALLCERVFSQAQSRNLQNVGWFIGYDPTIATPFPSAQFHDQGYKQPLFKFTEFGKTADRGSSIPKHTDFHRELQCTGIIDVDIIDTYDQYISSLQKSTTVNNHSRFCRGFWFFKRCYSIGHGFSSYSYQMEQHINDKKRGFIQASANCGLYWGQILLDDLPQFQPGFIKAVRKLPDTYDPENPEPFHDFFKKYGTNFISKVYLGSEIGKFYEVSQETLNTVRDQLRRYTSWSYANGWGLSSSQQSTPQSGSLNYIKKQSYSEISYSKGVVIPESDKISQWMQNIEQEPTPIKIELTSISDTFETIEERGLIDDFEFSSKVEVFEKAVEDYFKLSEENAKNNKQLKNFGNHETKVDPTETLGYCVFCQSCGGKYPQNGGWVDHPGGDFLGFGPGCSGESARIIVVGAHYMCCSKPNYDRQGFCRYVFLQDHIKSEIQNQAMTIQGSIKVSGNPHAYALTALGYKSPRYSTHQLGLACTNQLCSLCTSCGGMWPYLQSGYWHDWSALSRGAQCEGKIQNRRVSQGARLCCKNSDQNMKSLRMGLQ